MVWYGDEYGEALGIPILPNHENVTENESEIAEQNAKDIESDLEDEGKRGTLVKVRETYGPPKWANKNEGENAEQNVTGVVPMFENDQVDGGKGTTLNEAAQIRPDQLNASEDGSKNLEQICTAVVTNQVVENEHDNGQMSVPPNQINKNNESEKGHENSPEKSK